jgi:hypothetical protein
VEANSTGGQGSRRAVAPSDDDDDERCMVALHEDLLLLQLTLNCHKSALVL